jgi:hypothetical protein
MLNCPYGDRSDIPSKNALRMHVSRVHKKTTKPEERAEPLKIQDTKKITHPYSDEWDCSVCFHRFSSLEAADEHYQKRHVEKIPYESETEPNQREVEKPVNITEYLNELARQRAQELRQSLYAPKEGIVRQQLFTLSEPSSQTPIVESESREESKPREQESERPQSTAVYDFLRNLFKGKNKVSKQPIPETRHIFIPSRGVGVDGVDVSISTQPYFCKTENRYLSWNEYLTCKTLGHEVIYTNE